MGAVSPASRADTSPVTPRWQAQRPTVKTYVRNTASTSTPTLIRAQVGNGEGVTNASTTPETASTTTSPRATAMADRPSSARARERVRGPGSTQDQNNRRPVAPAMKTAVSSSSPCGRTRPKNRDCLLYTSDAADEEDSVDLGG